MTFQTKKIERDWILVTYDVQDSNAGGNQLRDDIRRKLLKEMGAIYQNDSVYLVPKKVHSADQIKKWGMQNWNIRLVVFGLDATLEDCKSISKRYVQDLRLKKKDCADKVKEVWEQIIEVENGERTLTGFHQKIKEIHVNFDQLRNLINRYGNKHDEFKLQSLHLMTKKCEDRYKRIVDSA